jgi:signal peptidase I
MQPTTLLADPALHLQSVRSAATERAVRGQPGAASARVARPRRHLGWLPLAAVIAVIVGGACFLRAWPPLATVLSASMEPTIKTGDMVVLKRLGRPAQIGDVVVVHVPDEARSRYGYPPVVIHRVVRIARDSTVSTKGDAKKERDPFTVPRRALTTRVAGHIPAGGRVFAFFTSTLGLLWLAGGVLLFLGMPVLDRRRDARDRQQDETFSVHATLSTITAELSLLRAERSEPRPERPDGRAELERALEAATISAAASQEQLRAVAAALTEHLEHLPERIERAVAAAVSALAVPPPAEPAVILAPTRPAPPKHATGPLPDLWPAQAPIVSGPPAAGPTLDLWPGQALQAPAGPTPELWPAQAPDFTADATPATTADLWPGQAPQVASVPTPVVPTPDLWPAQAPALSDGPASDPTADLWPGDAPRHTDGGRRPVSKTGPTPGVWPAPDRSPSLKPAARLSPDVWPTQDVAAEPRFEGEPETAMVAAEPDNETVVAEPRCEREPEAETAAAEPDNETAVVAAPEIETEAVEAPPEPEADNEPDPEPEADAAPDSWPAPPPDLLPALRPSVAPPVRAPSVGPPGSPSWDALPPALRRRRSGGLLNSADRFARRALASNAVRSRLSVIQLRGSAGRPF